VLSVGAAGGASMCRRPLAVVVQFVLKTCRPHEGQPAARDAALVAVAVLRDAPLLLKKMMRYLSASA
jgi:hypothetical protein